MDADRTPSAAQKYDRSKVEENDRRIVEGVEKHTRRSVLPRLSIRSCRGAKEEVGVSDKKVGKTYRWNCLRSEIAFQGFGWWLLRLLRGQRTYGWKLWKP